MLTRKGTFDAWCLRYIDAGLVVYIPLSRCFTVVASTQNELVEKYLSSPSLWRHRRSSKRNQDHLNYERESSPWLDSQYVSVGGDVQPRHSADSSHQPGFDYGGNHDRSGRRMVSLPTFLFSHSSQHQQTRSVTNACSQGNSEVGIWVELCQKGQPTEAVQALDHLVQRGLRLDNSIFYVVIKKCMAQKDLVLGSRVHALAVKSGYESNPFLANHIICMYAGHGRLEEVVRVFAKVVAPNRYMWASVILAHARHGQPREAITLYRQMRQSLIRPNNHVFVAALKACSTAEDLACGMEIHADILASAEKQDIVVQNCLVDVYAKCGSLNDARRVFDTCSNKDVVTWTAMIAGYTRHGLGQEALSLYARMEQEGITPANHVTFSCLLQACAMMGALHQGKQIHSRVLERGIGADIIVSSSLINMYAKCGSLEDARRVFDNLPSKQVLTWNAMLAGYIQQGCSQEALTLYATMQWEGRTAADSATFVCLLQACGSVGGLEKGKEIHSEILRTGIKLTDLFVANALINMYSKCGSLEDACEVFESLPTRDLATWTAMMGAYAQHGLGEQALSLYASMQHEGMTPADGVTFACLLQACATIGDLHQGKELHTQIQLLGLEIDGDIGNSLVNMYAKCGSLEDAHWVFANLQRRSLVTWNSMIAGYVQHGLKREALSLYGQMQLEGTTSADAITFVCLLQACSSRGFLHDGKQLHAQIQKRGLESDLMVGNCLVHMYAMCGSLEDSRKVFDSLTTRNVVTWNAMIAGYTQHGLGQEALAVYESMQQEGITSADAVTFICLLQACASVQALCEGKQLHAQIHQRGLEADVAVGNCLVNMYAKCGNLEDANRVFYNLPNRDVVTWNAMIAGYSQHGLGPEALTLYGTMQHEGLTPADAVTFACLLQACASTGALQQGKQLHRQIQENGLEADVIICNCLISMYAKCGSLKNARNVFDKMPTRDVVTWNTMIAVYSQHGLGHECVTLYDTMQREGITPADAVTFVCLLQTCGFEAGLEKGKEIHAQVLSEVGIDNWLVRNALIDMYGKCGSMVDAQQVFDALPTRDIVTWSALIAGYSRQGESEIVFDLFRQMKEDGIQPNAITFLSVLAVCSHVGLVDKGQSFFEAMSKDYAISPSIEHYSCMVDLFGRSGHLDKAMELMNCMPFEPHGDMWRSLLGACQKWSNLEMAREAFECAVRLNQNDAAAYVLMSNIYAAAHRTKEAKAIQAMRVKAQAWKKPGHSWWTDHDGNAHLFVVGESLHPRRQQIHAELGTLNIKMEEGT